jgi:hypothetical protein
MFPIKKTPRPEQNHHETILSSGNGLENLYSVNHGISACIVTSVA